MKNKTKLRIFQIYLHASKYDIKERFNVQQVLIEHIQQALNKNYHIIVMGDFNVNTDNKRPTESHYIKQHAIIDALLQRNFLDANNLFNDISETNKCSTWFNTSKQIESRIDYIWISSSLSNLLLYFDNAPSELYPSDHNILTVFIDKSLLF